MHTLTLLLVLSTPAADPSWNTLCDGPYANFPCSQCVDPCAGASVGWGYRRYRGPYNGYATRGTHRNIYPPVHGALWRRPWNYRNLFDYPWHVGVNNPLVPAAYLRGDPPPIPPPEPPAARVPEEVAPPRPER